MSAPISKSDLAFSLPASLSYHSTWDDADYEPVQPQRRHGLFARLAAPIVARVQAWSVRERAVSELSAMSDRDLADIGLTRSDIPRVSDPDFIAERAAAA
jgi:uncharacterized protein YjiS (DUF1127 family)